MLHLFTPARSVARSTVQYSLAAGAQDTERKSNIAQCREVLQDYMQVENCGCTPETSFCLFRCEMIKIIFHLFIFGEKT